MHYYFALMIMYSDELNNKALWPEMIRQSLWIADMRLDILEKTSRDLFYRFKDTSKALNKRMEGFLNNNKARQRKAKMIKLAIHAKATDYINSNKNLSSIVGLIHTHGGFDLSKRTINKHLKDHPLMVKHWISKKKK